MLVGSIAFAGCVQIQNGGRVQTVRYVDEFDLSGSTCGYGKQTLPRRSVDGNILTVVGKSYERGFGSHPEGAIGFSADGKVLAFDALVGIDDDGSRCHRNVARIHINSNEAKQGTSQDEARRAA